ncbi:unnamed protein product [Urochloa humidicola]
MVADFGLTKLAEIGSASESLPTLVGTFDYMPPKRRSYCQINTIRDTKRPGLSVLVGSQHAIRAPGSSSGTN